MVEIGIEASFCVEMVCFESGTCTGVAGSATAFVTIGAGLEAATGFEDEEAETVGVASFFVGVCGGAAAVGSFFATGAVEAFTGVDVGADTVSLRGEVGMTIGIGVVVVECCSFLGETMLTVEERALVGVVGRVTVDAV